MKDKILHELELARLRSRYSTLSEVESLFPRTSKHKVLQAVSREMNRCLSKIEKLENES